MVFPGRRSSGAEPEPQPPASPPAGEPTPAEALEAAREALDQVSALSERLDGVIDDVATLKARPATGGSGDADTHTRELRARLLRMEHRLAELAEPRGAGADLPAADASATPPPETLSPKAARRGGTKASRRARRAEKRSGPQ